MSDLSGEVFMHKIETSSGSHEDGRLISSSDERQDGDSIWQEGITLRCQSVEAVSGQLKSQLGFRQFSLRGLSKAKGEFALLCSAFNIKKLHKCLNYYGKAGSLALLGKFSLKVITFGCFLPIYKGYLSF